MALTLSRPVHPGEVLREEFLEPLRLSSYGLAKRMGVPRTRIERVAREESPITTDTALRLARVFGTTPELWLNLQRAFDVMVESEAMHDELFAIEPYEALAG